MEHGGSAGMRKGRAGTAPGSGTGLRLHLHAGIAPGDPSIAPPSAARLPWSRAGSLRALMLTLRFLTRCHAESRPSEPRESEVVSGRRGDDRRPAVDLGAHFPTPPVCVRIGPPEGAPGGRPPSPGPGLRGRVFGDRWRRAPSSGAWRGLEVHLEWAAWERSAWQKRQRPALPLLSGAGVLKAELRSLGRGHQEGS